MATDLFDSLFSDYTYLTEESLRTDPSGLAALELTYPKVLLLASASYLENATIEAILSLYAEPQPQELRIFVEKQALTRKFHTLFDWKNQKATGFFGFFGEDCKARYTEKRSAQDFCSKVDAFLQVGSLRNSLVHQNYADFDLGKTAGEIRDLHQEAKEFPSLIPQLVRPDIGVRLS